MILVDVTLFKVIDGKLGGSMENILEILLIRKQRLGFALGDSLESSFWD